MKFSPIACAFTAAIHGALFLTIILGDTCSTADAHAIDEKDYIEAALMMKSTPQNNQPQKARKKTSVAPPTIDPTAKPTPTKKPTPKPIEEEFDPEKLLAQERQRLGDPDGSEAAEDPTVPGPFNGSAEGWATETIGDPWFIDLYQQTMQAWELPTLERGTGKAAGCYRFRVDGTIEKVEIRQSSKNTNIDRSVQVALLTVQKQRQKKPVPIPKHLIRETVSKWRCVPFPV